MKRTISEKVTRTQYVSHDCLLCGEDNPFGLHGHFYELEDGEVVGVFHPRPEHQSYPGHTHGGIISAMLDETIARAATIGRDEVVYAVTTRLEVTFRKPVPYDQEVRCVGRVDTRRRRMYDGSGEILASDGTVLASAKGTFAVLAVDQIAGDVDLEGREMFPDPTEPPERIEIG